MRRPSCVLSATFAWSLSALIGAGTTGANQQFPIDPVILSAEPFVRERASVEVAGGLIVAGHFGGQMENCGTGTQGFVEKIGEWQRCQHSPQGGTCGEEGGAPLFDGFTCFDPDHIKASSVYGLFEEANGNLLVTGEVLLAWEDVPSADIMTARGAFILRLGPDGVPLAGTCIGPQPDGPPATEDCCAALCEIDGGGNGGGATGSSGSCGGRAVAAVDGGRVVATGWCESPADVFPVNKNYYVTSFSNDLAVQHWTHVGTCKANEVGQAIAVAPGGKIFFTGYGGEEHDIIVGKYRPTGVRLAFETGSGAMLDEGVAVEFDDDGAPVITARINGETAFGGVALGESGDGEQNVSLTLDSSLQVTFLEVNPLGQDIPAVPPGGNLIARLDGDVGTPGSPMKMVQMPHQTPVPPPPVPPPPPPPETEKLTPVDFHVDIGILKAGSLQGLVTSGTPLVITENEDPDDPGALRIQYRIDMQPIAEPFKVSSLSLRLEADACYTATIEVQGLLSDEFFLVGERDVVCPADSPLLVADISPELSALWGLDEVLIPDPQKRLVIRVTMDYHHTLDCPCTCQGECDCNCLCSTNLEDGSFDGVEGEY